MENTVRSIRRLVPPRGTVILAVRLLRRGRDDDGAGAQLWDYAGVSGVSPWQCGDDRHPAIGNVVIDPEIPLTCPKGMAIYGDWLFITDMFTHRVIRCRLEYSDRKEAALGE